MDRIRRELAACGDADRAVQQQRYMRSAIPFHGVRMGDVRRIVRAALRDDAIVDRPDLVATVTGLWDGVTHREQWYAALAVLQAPGCRTLRDVTLLPLYDHLVVTGRWWDVVDDIATHGIRELLLRDPDRVAPLMRSWSRDDDLWRRRASLVCQVGAGDATDRHLLQDVVLANIGGTDFFLRKGVGWALRDFARTDPEWVRQLVARHGGQMSAMSVREATKHL